MKIFVVVGTTGEYSERTEWPVCAYRDEAAARAKVERLTKRVKEWEAVRENEYISMSDEYKDEDPQAECDYTGTTYFVYDVELIDADR